MAILDQSEECNLKWNDAIRRAPGYRSCRFVLREGLNRNLNRRCLCAFPYVSLLNLLNLQGITKSESFDASNSWKACMDVNRRLERAAAAPDPGDVAFTELDAQDRRTLLRAEFDTVTKPWSNEFNMRRGYAHLASVLGDSCFWRRAEGQEGITEAGAFCLQSTK
jgi:hypothetical protein